MAEKVTRRMTAFALRRTAVLAVVLLASLRAAAQEDACFFQLSMTETSFYSNQERGLELPQGLFGGFRSSPGVSLAVGKWVSPEVGLRLKMNGFGCRTVLSDDGEANRSRYWALFGDVMLNVGRLLSGGKGTGRWDVCPYVGGGINRNYTYDEFGIGLRLGLQNSWRLGGRWSMHLDMAYAVYEPDTDGVDPHEGVVPGKHRHTLGNRDRTFGMELGLTYSLGK